MSEFEAKRPRLVVAPVKCSGHLTGTENRGPAHGPPSSLPPSRESPQPTCTNKKMHVRAYTSEHSDYREKGIPKTESPPPAGAKGRGFAGFGRKRKIHRPEGLPARRRRSAWQAWAPGPELPMAAVLTTILVEMVKTPAIRKRRLRETTAKSGPQSQNWHFARRKRLNLNLPRFH